MSYSYNSVHSEMVEQTLLSILACPQEEWTLELTQKERGLLARDLDTFEEIRKVFHPYQERLKRLYLMRSGWSILTTFYLYLLNRGEDPASMEELHDLVLEMTEEELHVCLHLFLAEEDYEKAKDQDYWDMLQGLDLKAEEKWHILTFSHQIVESVQDLVALSRALVPLYQPYLEESRRERESFAQTLEMETILAQAPFLKDLETNLHDQSFEMFVISPWMTHFVFFMMTEKVFPLLHHFVILSSKVDQILHSHNDLDEENFVAILKTLSDLTRYKVLVALTQPHAKVKDIAEDLGITSAAVSFHRQKLQNAMLLVYNLKEKNTKYDVNQLLLQDLVLKIKEDFSLED
ncbi:winged helix-turn-helix transcriptional regulator [Streptococcus sp. DD13]|uniref:winged helix-turn-helix transcriptional regulator n=1 Tax=Streptococcus sp. DD13 TaxID=1777881 RepID=UPI00079A9997|nr:winged helix-turn-helix transcriptional regulator [Streptococcus sp. DD13]KXT79217.1 putative transcriptional regulator [Streptococcus sp. DD13]